MAPRRSRWLWGQTPVLARKSLGFWTEWRVPGPALAKEVGGLIRLPFIAVDWTTRRGR